VGSFLVPPIAPTDLYYLIETITETYTLDAHSISTASQA